MEYDNFVRKMSGVNPQDVQNKINNMTIMVQELTLENTQLKDKVKYLEDKMRQLITEQIQFKKQILTAQQN